MIKKIITGEYQPHLESALAREVRELKRADPLEPVTIVVPTNALGLHLSRALARELGGHAEIRALTLLDLARRLALRSMAAAGLSPMPAAADLLLLRESVDGYLSERAGSYFARVASRDGFLRVLLAAIDDMKEGCVCPDDLDRAVCDAGLGGVGQSKIREVAAIWRTYEKRKRAVGLYDRADLMAQAVASAGSGTAEATHRVFYGFYDLNPLQRRLVESCAARADTFFFLPYADSEDYEYARPTLEWLSGAGFAPAVDAGGAPGPKGARGGSAGSGRDRPAASDPASGGAAAGASAGDCHKLAKGGPRVLILSAAGEERECREAAREVLRLAGLGRDARAGAEEFRLNEVGVLLRDPSRYAEHFARAFQSLGVEPFVGEGLPLLGTRAGRSLFLLMDLIEGDFSRREVMDLLTYAELNAAGPSSLGASGEPAHWDLVSKEAGVMAGMDQWREKLSALAGGRDAPARSRRRRVGGASGDGETARSLLSIVEFLWGAISSLHDEGSPALLAEELRALYCSVVAPGRERDAVAAALRGLSALESCSGSIDRASFYRIVREQVETTRVRLGSLHGEGPVIGGLMTSRGLPFKVVIVPGLVEGLFPAPPRQDPILLDWERRALNSAFQRGGIDAKLGLKSERTKEERLLFRLVAGAASRHLLLSFPRVDPATGAERLPSEFVLEVARSIAGARCDAAGLDELSFYKRVPLARPFPDDGSFMDRTEFDLMAADRAVAGEAAAADYLKAGGGFTGASIEAARRRWGEFKFTPYDGVLESPESIELLRGGFLGRHGVASPTALERYAGCPFLFFMSHVLKIEPVEEPEEVLEIAPMDRGSLAHSILERAYRRLFRGGRGPRGDWERELAAIAREALEEFRAQAPFGLPLLWELGSQSLVSDLTASVDEDINDLGGFTPWRFELRYGLSGSPEGAPKISLEGGRAVPIGGKIDRVDLDGSAGAARVIDYKTGGGKGFKDGRLMGGTTLQLPLYVIGARHVLAGESDVAGAEYYFVSGARRGERVRFTSEDLDARMGDVVTVVSTIARCIERGVFFACPSNSCSYCDYRMACGPARILFERKQADPRAHEYLRMRAIE